jgi:hypothetical protein
MELSHDIQLFFDSHCVTGANVYATSLSLLDSLNKLLYVGESREGESILTIRARRQLTASFDSFTQDSVTAFVKSFFQTDPSVIMLFADLVDLREGLGAFVVANKIMQSKGDILKLLFIFFLCVDQCVLSVRKHVERQEYFSRTLIKDLEAFGVVGSGSFYLFFINFNNDENFRKGFIVRCLGDLHDAKPFSHCKQAFLTSYGLQAEDPSVEFLDIPYNKFDPPLDRTRDMCRETASLALRQFFNCEIISRGGVPHEFALADVKITLVCNLSPWRCARNWRMIRGAYSSASSPSAQGRALNLHALTVIAR